MEEEISLRELIEIILNGKWIIAAITIIAVLISGIFSFFVIAPTYEAQSTLMVSPMVQRTAAPGEDSAYDALLSYLSQYPQMSLETYRVQVTNPHILNQVIEELDLDPEKYSTTSLRDMISVQAIQDTNLIKIAVKDKNPEMSAKIANTLAPKYVDFISKTLQEQMGKSATFLQTQMKEEQKNLDAVTEELKNFLSKPQSVDELQKDIDAKLELITEFKTKLVELDVEEKATRASLESAKAKLAAEPKFFDVEKSIIDDAIMAGLAANKTGSMSDAIGLTMKSQEINENYTLLSERASELEVILAGLSSQRAALTSNIQKTQTELESLQATLAKKRTEYNRLQQQYTIAQDTYNTFLQKYQEARITTSSNIGDANIMVVSPAIVPEKPVAPKKALNVAIAMVLGLMVGIFTVFFMDYWKNSADAKTVKTIS
ncbi:GumC family protein [Tepidanaerobacter acetatoxydans]|uniref:GumC family protein n=1 Tax=Tepidanaerobacter acetatoxydans TaxID=499229 RepID=UPI001BD2C469|nr:GNVR domain-containing protein [Tepidanaerobacter acetatoxydans]